VPMSHTCVTPLLCAFSVGGTALLLSQSRSYSVIVCRKEAQRDCERGGWESERGEEEGLKQCRDKTCGVVEHKMNLSVSARTM